MRGRREDRWLPCAVTVLVKVQGIHVSWVSVGALELVYWYVWAWRTHRL